MSTNPAKRPINLGQPGAAKHSLSKKPGMSAGRKSTLAIGLIAAGGMSIFAFTPREQCEVDPATGLIIRLAGDDPLTGPQSRRARALAKQHARELRKSGAPYHLPSGWIRPWKW